MEAGQRWLRIEDEAAEKAREVLLAEYRRLVRVELPAAARAGKWVLRRDHCFARVILDAICGGCWYTHLPRGRSAESQLGVAQLVDALRTGRGMLTGGGQEVARLNAQSLRWRNKACCVASGRPCGCRAGAPPAAGPPRG